MTTGQRPPALRVVSGSPTAEELAALAAVVTAAAAGEPPAAEQTLRGRWNDPAARLRQPLLAGPNGWRASAR